MSILVAELGRVWADVYDLYNSTMTQIREIWHDNGMPWAYIVIVLAGRANIVNFRNELAGRAIILLIVSNTVAMMNVLFSAG